MNDIDDIIDDDDRDDDDRDDDDDDLVAAALDDDLAELDLSRVLVLLARGACSLLTWKKAELNEISKEMSALVGDKSAFKHLAQQMCESHDLQVRRGRTLSSFRDACMEEEDHDLAQAWAKRLLAYMQRTNSDNAAHDVMEMLQTIADDAATNLFNHMFVAYRRQHQQAEPRGRAAVKKDPEAALLECIGLANVKQQVSLIVAQSKMRHERLAAGLPVIPSSQHLVFSGNPGTGKTTVARLLGEIYAKYGVLKSGHSVEVGRSDLVGEYIGKTARLTSAAIEKAIDGVLFVDEAYSLTQNEGDHGASFGGEAVNELVTGMENNRDRLVVIVAGYSDLMTDFINSNAGLRSRFATTITFDDYEPSELFAIFKALCSAERYEMSRDTEQAAIKMFGAMYEDRDESFGNGRDVRNVFERTKARQDLRLHTSLHAPSDLCMLLAEDLPWVEPERPTRRTRRAVPAVESIDSGGAVVQRSETITIGYLLKSAGTLFDNNQFDRTPWEYLPSRVREVSNAAMPRTTTGKVSGSKVQPGFASFFEVAHAVNLDVRSASPQWAYKWG